MKGILNFHNSHFHSTYSFLRRTFFFLIKGQSHEKWPNKSSLPYTSCHPQIVGWRYPGWALHWGRAAHPEGARCCDVPKNSGQLPPRRHGNAPSQHSYRKLPCFHTLCTVHGPENWQNKLWSTLHLLYNAWIWKHTELPMKHIPLPAQCTDLGMHRANYESH